MVISARYPGRCRDCGGPIHAGDAIQWSRKGGARHVSCPLPQAQAAPPVSRALPTPSAPPAAVLGPSAGPSALERIRARMRAGETVPLTGPGSLMEALGQGAPVPPPAVPVSPVPSPAPVRELPGRARIMYPVNGADPEVSFRPTAPDVPACLHPVTEPLKGGRYRCLACTVVLTEAEAVRDPGKRPGAVDLDLLLNP